ncbi:unnamed protein product, partial [Gulo gulo]
MYRMHQILSVVAESLTADRCASSQAIHSASYSPGGLPEGPRVKVGAVKSAELGLTSSPWSPEEWKVFTLNCLLWETHPKGCFFGKVSPLENWTVLTPVGLGHTDSETSPQRHQRIPGCVSECDTLSTWVAQSVKRLPPAQVMTPGSWDRALHWAPCSVG